jgi:hypothetical protein
VPRDERFDALRRQRARGVAARDPRVALVRGLHRERVDARLGIRDDRAQQRDVRPRERVDRRRVEQRGRVIDRAAQAVAPR